eukprot:scaffold3318_cov110-Isochrysis_galbana.AAC.5
MMSNQSSKITSLAPNQALRDTAMLRARSSGSDVVVKKAPGGMSRTRHGAGQRQWAGIISR